jgi:hypothetical protein
MIRALLWTFGALAALLLTAAVLASLVVWMAWPVEWNDAVRVTINGHTWALEDLLRSQGPWTLFGVLGAALLVALALTVVLPLALLLGAFGLLLGLGAAALGLAAVLGIAALPLLLPVLLVVWLWRRDRRPPVTPS